MENPEDYQYDIDCSEVASYGVVVVCVVGSWLLDLTADVLRHDRELISSMEGYQIAVKVAGLFMPLSIWVYPLLLSVRRCLSVLNLVVWGHDFRVQSIERYASNVWRT